MVLVVLMVVPRVTVCAGAKKAIPKHGPPKKAKLDDFTLMKTVGKGSFGKVVMVRATAEHTHMAYCTLTHRYVVRQPRLWHTLLLQVKHKGDGQIYAMKVLKKEMVLRRKQFEHTLSERRCVGNKRQSLSACLLIEVLAAHCHTV